MRWLRWGGMALALIVVAGFFAFRLSPWPTVAIIAYAFSDGDQASEAALEKHVPGGIVTRADLRYGSKRDELFDLYRRESAPARQATIVWVHGGAWIAGSKAGVANYLRVLAGRGFTTIGVEYSTGRKSRYPQPVEQVNAALGHILRNADALGVDPDHIILAGDSAGAQIAAQVSLLTTDPAYARALGVTPQLDAQDIKGLLLLSGAYDIGSVDLHGDYGWFVRTILWAYSGSHDFMNDERFRLASITDHVTSNFPPSFVSSGNGDPLLPQAKRLTERLRLLGVPVEALFFPDGHEPALPHEYQFNLDDPAGRKALDRIVNFARLSKGGAASTGTWMQQSRSGAHSVALAPWSAPPLRRSYGKGE
ncbi:MAG: alpha/beta hydrolase [Pseudomonadota bacterium]|uniref:alpha/beta hydrolase n=1 Tax=Sphingobium naphthae TaxID=1886786 RepID=UPI002B09613D|nr:alpha/beta hydrolase [Pseudomonadota bacterium]